jgi:uncharacterized membrane protein
MYVLIGNSGRRKAMSQRDFWNGFGAGAAVGVIAGVGSALTWRAVRGRSIASEVMRVEKTVQIGRPLDDVFHAWSDLASLPRYIPMIRSVRPFGRRSHWMADIKGKRFEWDAELVQDMDNQALGWRSLSGPKHTGRISFAPLGNDTLVHVQMNYVPPMGSMGRAVLETFEHVDQYIEQALRDFKAALEGKGQENAQPRRATGTEGARPVEAGVSTPPPSAGTAQTSRYGNQEQTIEYTRPPDAKS